MSKLTAKQAKELLLPVPAEEFVIHIFSDNEGKCCVIGHLQRLISNNPDDYVQYLSDWDNDNDTGIRELSKEFLRKKHEVDKDIADVNNGGNINGYTEPVIKNRVIHLLDDMIEAGY